MLADCFIHRHGRAQNTSANISAILDLEQTLDRAILTEGAMQDREDHIDGSDAFKLVSLASIQIRFAAVAENQGFLEGSVFTFAESLMGI